MTSQQRLKVVASQQQRFTGEATNAKQQQQTIEATSAKQQQPRTPSYPSLDKEAEVLEKEMQQLPHKHPSAMSHVVGSKPSLEKKVADESMGATKPLMSQTPSKVLETMTLDKDRVIKDINTESVHSYQRKVSNPYFHATGDTQHKGRSPPHIHVESELRQNRSLVESSSCDSEDYDEVENIGPSVNIGKSSKPQPRKHTVVPNWPDNVKFNDKDEALAFDVNGNHHLVKSPVQPRDVWRDQELRYYVEFDAFNQPLRKGGSILVCFLGDIAKKESFCPVGYSSWHKLKVEMKADIVTLVRKHFIIPSGELFDKAILKRTSRCWKRYRFVCRQTYFDAEKRTKDQIVNNKLDGVNKQNWTDLVDYWYSSEFQEEAKGTFSELDFYKKKFIPKETEALKWAHYLVNFCFQEHQAPMVIGRCFAFLRTTIPLRRSVPNVLGNNGKE